MSIGRSNMFIKIPKKSLVKNWNIYAEYKMTVFIFLVEMIFFCNFYLQMGRRIFLTILKTSRGSYLMTRIAVYEGSY